MQTKDKQDEKQERGARRAGIVILICAAIVIFWEGAGLLARQRGDDFKLKPEHLESFELEIPGWRAERLEVTPTFMEVNLLKLRLRRIRSAETGMREEGRNNLLPTTQQPSNPTTARDFRSAEILVRLVHGYNMVDCMRIKGYTVEEINGAVDGLLSSQVVKLEEDTPPITPVSEQSTIRGTANNQQPTTDLRSAQIWRLTSKAGDESLWMSGMLRAGDFAVTDLSTTDMAFPRIGIPDDPSWIPRGLTLKSLRHPIRNLKWFLRAKWNNSRCDLLTFLGLRRPAWASDDAITLLVISEQKGTEELMADVYREVLVQLQEWRAERE